MSKSIMCHVVAGFPDADGCVELMRGMQDAGVTSIEVQIPFSDPIADGETIMQANDVALTGGMTTVGSFELLEKARQAGVTNDLYIMSYIQKLHHYGFQEFCEQAAASQVKGLIIPDLPYDAPEFAELKTLADEHQLDIVPVLSPQMSDTRLAAVMATTPTQVYVTTSQGITGNDYTPSVQLKKVVDQIRQLSSAKIMIGFGISSPQEVDDVLAIGDVAVVGSAVIKRLQTSTIEETLSYVQSLVTGG